MKEEEGAFPEACSLGVEMKVALGWRRLKEHCVRAWCSWGLKTEVHREDCWEGGSTGLRMGGRMEDCH